MQRVVDNYFAAGDKNNLALGDFDTSDLNVPLNIGNAGGSLPPIPAVSLPQINIAATAASSELRSGDDLHGYNTYWGLNANADIQIVSNIGGTTYHRTMAERVDSALARASDWVDEQAQNVADSGVQAIRDGNNGLAAYQAFMYTPTKTLANVINGFINLPRLATSDEMVPNLVRAVGNPSQTFNQIVNAAKSNSLQDNTAMALSMLVPFAPKLAENVGAFGRVGTYLDGTVGYTAGRGVTLTTAEGSFNVRSPIFVNSPAGQLNSGIPIDFRNPFVPANGVFLETGSGSSYYRPLDTLGRPTGVDASITPDMIRTGTPADPSITPPGWAGNGTLYNQARGHLLGNQLGGSGNLPENLVTLQQNWTNSPVMRGFENQVRSAVEAGDIVQYSSTPIYSGNNLIPKGVTLIGSGKNGFSLGVTVLNPIGF